jgi:hypothetical protein
VTCASFLPRKQQTQQNFESTFQRNSLRSSERNSLFDHISRSFRTNFDFRTKTEKCRRCHRPSISSTTAADFWPRRRKTKCLRFNIFGLFEHFRLQLTFKIKDQMSQVYLNIFDLNLQLLLQ